MPAAKHYDEMVHMMRFGAVVCRHRDPCRVDASHGLGTADNVPRAVEFSIIPSISSVAPIFHHIHQHRCHPRNRLNVHIPLVAERPGCLHSLYNLFLCSQQLVAAATSVPENLCLQVARGSAQQSCFKPSVVLESRHQRWLTPQELQQYQLQQCKCAGSGNGIGAVVTCRSAEGSSALGAGRSGRPMPAVFWRQCIAQSVIKKRL